MLLKFALIFFPLFLVMSINLSDNMLARLGLNLNKMSLWTGLLAFIITGMCVHRKLASLILIILLAIGANFSNEMLNLSFDYNRDILTATLVAVVLMPWLKKQF